MNAARKVCKKYETEKMKIEIHTLKDYPPSLLNRDDAGNAKQATISGIPRFRISSPCRKYAYRSDKTSLYDYDDDVVMRTRRIGAIIADCFRENGCCEEYCEAASRIAPLYISSKIERDKIPGEYTTPQIMHYSESDVLAIMNAIYEQYPSVEAISPLADYVKNTMDKIIENDKKKKKGDAISCEFKGEDTVVTDKLVETAGNRLNALEISMYGRMSVSGVARTVESSIYVSHSMGIEPFTNEVDYYTAVEGFIKDTDVNLGSAMMGESDLVSSCVYEYTAIDVMNFCKNAFIGVDVNDNEAVEKRKAGIVGYVVDTILKLLHTAPVAKQHASAAYPDPSVTYIKIFSKGHANTLNCAFSVPVTHSAGKSVAMNGVERMVNYINHQPSRFMFEHKKLWMPGSEIIGIMNEDNKGTYCPEGADMYMREDELLHTIEQYVKEYVKKYVVAYTGNKE